VGRRPTEAQPSKLLHGLCNMLGVSVDASQAEGVFCLLGLVECKVVQLTVLGLSVKGRVIPLAPAPHKPAHTCMCMVLSDCEKARHDNMAQDVVGRLTQRLTIPHKGELQSNLIGP